MNALLNDFTVNLQNGNLSKKFFSTKNLLERRDIIEKFVLDWYSSNMKKSEYSDNDIFKETSSIYDMVFDGDNVKPDYADYILLSSDIRTSLHESLIESIIAKSIKKSTIVNKDELNSWVSQWCYDHMDESTYSEESIDADTDDLYDFIINKSTYDLKPKISALF